MPKTRSCPEAKHEHDILNLLISFAEKHILKQKDKKQVERWSGKYWKEGAMIVAMFENLARLPRIRYKRLRPGIDRLEALFPRPNRPEEQDVLVRMHQVTRRMEQYNREWDKYPRIALALADGLEAMWLSLGSKDTIYSLEAVTEIACKGIVYHAKQHRLDENIVPLTLKCLWTCWCQAVDEPRIQDVLFATMHDAAGIEAVCSVINDQLDKQDDPNQKLVKPTLDHLWTCWCSAADSEETQELIYNTMCLVAGNGDLLKEYLAGKK